MKKLMLLLIVSMLAFVGYGQAVSTLVANGDTVDTVSDTAWVSFSQIGATNVTKALRISNIPGEAVIADQIHDSIQWLLANGDSEIIPTIVTRLDTDSIRTDVNDAHRVSTDNPHSVTATQAGALPVEDTVDLSTVVLLKHPTPNLQTGTSYTLALADDATFVRLTNGAAITLTVPLNAAVAFPLYTQITLIQGGAGTVTVTPTGGVTITSYLSATDLKGAGAYATLFKTGTDTWDLFGNIE